MKKDLKELSKQNWVPKSENGPTDEEIQTGCMQRIANATELMATNYLKLQSENDYLRNRNRNLQDDNDHLRRSANTYKGKYNRLKNIQK